MIKEIDWSVGRIREALERHGILDDTMFIFTSDNGPWLSYGDHAGTTGGLREGKGTTFEGACGFPWSSAIRLVPAGTTCRRPAMTVDLLPTIVEPPVACRGGRSTGDRSCSHHDPDAEDPHEAVLLVPERRARACGWVVGSSTSRTSTDRSRATGGSNGGRRSTPTAFDRAEPSTSRPIPARRGRLGPPPRGRGRDDRYGRSSSLRAGGHVDGDDRHEGPAAAERGHRGSK